MSLTKLLVPTYRQMLKTLSGWLEKAGAQMPAAASARPRVRVLRWIGMLGSL